MNNIGLSYLPFTGAYSIVVDMSQAKPGERVYLPDTPVLSDKVITGVLPFGRMMVIYRTRTEIL